MGGSAPHGRRLRFANSRLAAGAGRSLVATDLISSGESLGLLRLFQLLLVWKHTILLLARTRSQDLSLSLPLYCLTCPIFGTPLISRLQAISKHPRSPHGKPIISRHSIRHRHRLLAASYRPRPYLYEIRTRPPKTVHLSGRLVHALLVWSCYVALALAPAVT